MTGEDYNIEKELEQMKEQMGELKRLVGTKDLINQNLMRQVMAYKARWIKQYGKFQLFVLLPFIYLDFLFLHYMVGLSWLFYWATFAMCTVSVVIDVYINRLSADDYSSLPLLELMTQLVKRQKYRKLQLLIGLPVGALWCAWFVVEMRFVDFDGISWIGGIIGGIIGLICGFLITDKAQKTDAAAVRDIRNMMSD